MTEGQHPNPPGREQHRAAGLAIAKHDAQRTLNSTAIIALNLG
jgi:hypothetical protein